MWCGFLQQPSILRDGSQHLPTLRQRLLKLSLHGEVELPEMPDVIHDTLQAGFKLMSS